MFKRASLALIICISLVLGIHTLQAQDNRSTESNGINSFFLNPDLKGSGQNSVNLYSGDVNLPINLLTVSGRGGLNASVTASYSSNIQYERDNWALDAPSGILGMGWSMSYDKIIVDHKNTGSVHDDDFYLVSGGSTNELIMVSSTSATSGTKTFKTKNYQFWKITYYKSDERWEIVKEDGKTYVFGGGVSTVSGNKISDGNSIQWGVKWGNWIGSSMRTSGQSQHPVAWNLSKVKNTWGDELTYDYLVVEEQVGRYGVPDLVEPKRHTKASYLQKITTPEGKEIEFIYGEKNTDEYTDPHQELTTAYETYADFTGESQVIMAENNTWTAVVGNTSGTVSYLWEYQYFGQSGWTSGGTSATLTTALFPFDDIFNYTIRLTVTDSNGSTSVEKPVTILGDGRLNPDPECPSDCAPIPVLGSAAGGNPAALPAHFEPDAYQEKYETKFLSRIEVRNENSIPLYYIDFEYTGFGTLGDPDYKRLLARIVHEYPNGEMLPSLDFSYNTSSDVHPASLKKVTYPSGSEVTYTYTDKTISNSNRKLTINAPTGTEDPRVWIANDYVIVTWRKIDATGDDEIILKIYTWDGKWIEYDHGEIANTGELFDTDNTVIRDIFGIKLGNNDFIVQNFEIFIYGDSFVFVYDYYEKNSTRWLRFFRKNPNKPGEWYTNSTSITTNNSLVDVVIGDDLVAVAELVDDDVTVFRWNGQSWNNDTITYSSTDGSGNDTFIGGTSNYFVIDDEGKSGNDALTLFYLDELNKWASKTYNTSLQSSVTNSGLNARNYISAGNSLFSLSLNGANESIFKLGEDYSMQFGKNVGNITQTGAGVSFVNNELIRFANSGEGNDAKAYRFDGVSFNESTGTFTEDMFTHSLSNDLIIKRVYDYHLEDGSYKLYDPNTNAWKSAVYINDHFSIDTRLYTDAFKNIFLFGRKGYYREIDGSITSYGNMDPGTNKVIDYYSIQAGKEFITYNTDTCTNPPSCTQFSPIKNLRIANIKNGLITGYTDIGNNENIRATGNQRSDLVSGDIIVTYDDTGAMKDATELTLYKRIDEQISGNLKDYPVTKIQIDNGYETNQVVFDYDVSKARVGVSGYIAEYNKVTTKAGNPAEGRTEHYFFNGLSNSELTVDFPTTGPTNAEDHLSLVKGSIYKTRVYATTSGGSPISETTNYFEVTEKAIERASDSEQLEIAYYVRQTKTENTTEGVTTFVNTFYNSENGLSERSESRDYTTDGTEVINISEKIFAFEKYTNLKTDNILSYSVEDIIKIKTDLITSTETVTSKIVSTWKDWGAGKWSPHKTYIWDGSGSEVFNYTSWSGAGEPSSGWLKSGEIISRDNFGLDTEIKNAEGIDHSTIYGFNSTKVVADFTNAQLSEVRADGFDDISSPFSSLLGWAQYQGGSWTIEDGRLKAYKASSSGYLQATSGINHANSIIEFDVKFISGSSSDWMGLQFRLGDIEYATFDDGNYLKITKGGALSINRMTSTLASGTISGSTSIWRHVRLYSKSDGTINVYVDGELIANATNTSGVNNLYYGFIINGATVLIDNFRVYPNDAIANSIGYDPDYLHIREVVNSEGFQAQIIRDENQRIVEFLDNNGLVTSINSLVQSRQVTNNKFSATTPNATYQVSFPSYNAIRNSGGEYGNIANPDYWDVESGATIGRSKGEGYSGLYSLKYTTTSSGELSQTIERNDFLWEDKRYFVRFWIQKQQPFFTANPTITVSLEKTGSAVTSQTSFTLTTTDWYLFEAELNSEPGQFVNWNDITQQSKLVIKTNTNNMPLLIDDIYVGEMQYEGESRPGYFVSFSNGSGNPIQNQVWNGTDYTVSHIEYDDLGRQTKSWRPYSYATGNSYDSGYSIHASNHYVSGSSLYSETTYNADPLSRVESEIPFSNSTESIDYTYGPSESLHGINRRVQRVTDLGGMVTKMYFDNQGATIRSESGVGTADHIVTEREYDPFTRSEEIRPPNYFTPPGTSSASDWVTTTNYNFKGLPATVYNPDSGWEESGFNLSSATMTYNGLGQLRFSKTTTQEFNGLISYTSYDNLGRPTISGEAINSSPSGYETDELTYISVTEYDQEPVSTNFPWSLFSSQLSGIDQDNILNAVSAEAYKTTGKSAAGDLELSSATITLDLPKVEVVGDINVAGTGDYDIESGGSLELSSGERISIKDGFHAKSGSSFRASINSAYSDIDNNQQWQATFFSYDFDKRPTKKWILTQGKPELRTEISYQYNDANQVIRQHTKVGDSQNLYHFYTYDNQGRIKKVYAGISEVRSSTPLITYSYDIEGKVTQKIVSGASKASTYYTYDNKGRLKQIDADNSEFLHILSYNTDGTISSIASDNDLNNTTNYSYDNLDRMTAADVAGSNSYDVKGITYDKHGNILTLDRYKGSASLVDDLTYSYSEGTNQLSSLSDAVSTTGESWDAEDATFAYDIDGRLVGNTKTGGGNLNSISYGTSTLPIQMKLDGSIEASYLYNSSGWRIHKKVVDTNTSTTLEEEYYIMDGGRNLAVTDENGNIEYWNLYGNGLFGKMMPDILNTAGAISSESESNNTEATADGPIGTNTDGITGPGETDWFYFEITKAGSVTVNAITEGYSGSSQPLDWTVYKDGTSIKSGTGSSSVTVSPGTYHIKVTPTQGVTASDYIDLILTPSDYEETFYYVYDHVGSVRSVYNSSNQNVAKYDYYPYGLVMSSNVTETTKEGFTGKEQDDETGLHYFGSRYYDASLGRWSAIDPAGQFATPYGYSGNPLSYVDADGNLAWFIPIIIGAIVNVSVQAAMGNVDSFGQALGYAAVGAASAALGAGIGNGISAALGGARFGAGFAASFSGNGTLAASGINGVASSFMTGAAIGSSAGFGVGFTTGFGNSLVSGNTFGESLNPGLDYGWKGVVSGGLIGGIGGGIKAKRDGRRFFDGATVEDEILVDREIPFVKQKAQFDCGPAICEAVSSARGNTISQEEIRRALGGDPNLDPIIDKEIYDELTSRLNLRSAIRVPYGADPNEVVSYLELGGDVIYNIKAQPGLGHSVVVNRITQRTITKISGRVITRTIVHVMDPASNSQYKRIGIGTLKNAFSTFLIAPK